MCKRIIRSFITIFRFYVGLSDGAIPVPDHLWIGDYPNSYATPTSCFNLCWLTREEHQLELPEGAILPRRQLSGINVYGCGLVLDPEDKLSIFFTLNGNLLGELVLVIKVLF
jgi:hypothetical protein